MMNEDNKNGRDRQRLAWAVLLGSMAACLIITIAIPFSVNAYLQNSTRPLALIVQANQGTVRVEEDSVELGQAITAGEPEREIMPGANILTDATASALVSISVPDSERLLGRLQVYDNTNVTLEEARTPRFDLSAAGQMMQFDLSGGRMRLTILEMDERPLLVTIVTPQSEITIQEPGQYSLTVTNEETQIAVQAGSAHVVSLNRFVDLAADQRSVILTDAIPSPPLSAERNLIQNGDFSQGWNKWRQYAWEVELSNQPAGQIAVTPVNGVPVLYVRRDGSGHAETEARQTINQSITDSETLIFEIDFRIVSQSLNVCGSLGSECPLAVRIDYEDIDRNSQVWWQGFYAQGTGGAAGTPDVCETCPSPRFVHQKVVPGQIVSYRFDLKEDLNLQAFLPPRHINSVSLLIEGHSFEVEILRVAMISEEEISDNKAS